MAGYAIVGAAGYGASDFIGGLASRRHWVSTVMTASQTISLAVMAMLTLVIPGVQHPGDALRGGIGGVLVFAGIALVYAAFSRGDIGPAAALLGVFSALIPVVAAVLTGDPVGASIGVGLLAAVAAVVALADGHRDDTSGRSVAYAIGAGAAFGGYQVTMSTTSLDGGMWPLLAAQTVVAVLSLLWFLGTVMWGKAELEPTFPRLAVLAGVVEAIASAASLWAVRTGNLAVVGVIIALAPAGSVVLARLVLGERVTKRRMLGLGAAMVAVLALAGAPLVLVLLVAAAVAGVSAAPAIRDRVQDRVRAE